MSFSFCCRFTGVLRKPLACEIEKVQIIIGKRNIHVFPDFDVAEPW
jgi:hypothetical protein